jgi:septation ring formation regulator EzrA
MKKREVILIAVIVTAIIYFVSYIERKQTEKRVEEFIEQNESKED